MNGSRSTPARHDVEGGVLQRYKEGALKVEAGLCCPTTPYDYRFMELLPDEIIEKDYGCGDPSAYVSEGETVLDLGSGSGKICYILSQKVTSSGSVIGVDFNDEMLALSHKYVDYMGSKLGYHNVSFRKARIQDLALDLELAQKWLQTHPVRSVEQISAFEAECDRLRQEKPLIPDASVDVVVSNCVLNLVRPQDKRKLFAEIYRALKTNGRAVISDIVCDEEPTPSILANPDLWSGCIAGALREDRFLEMFAEAGFSGIEILSRQAEPWRVIEGIEFRSLTIRAFKYKEDPCLECNQALIYKGPWLSVSDDEGHLFYRGQRTAVCDKTFSVMTRPGGPYSANMIGISPHNEVPLDEAAPFDCKRPATRHPGETKGLEYRLTIISDEASCCGPDACC